MTLYIVLYKLIMYSYLYYNEFKSFIYYIAFWIQVSTDVVPDLMP